eukprot:2950373-Amphidinium_carterae.1
MLCTSSKFSLSLLNAWQITNQKGLTKLCIRLHAWGWGKAVSLARLWIPVFLLLLGDDAVKLDEDGRSTKRYTDSNRFYIPPKVLENVQKLGFRVAVCGVWFTEGKIALPNPSEILAVCFTVFMQYAYHSCCDHFDETLQYCGVKLGSLQQTCSPQTQYQILASALPATLRAAIKIHGRFEVICAKFGPIGIRLSSENETVQQSYATRSSPGRTCAHPPGRRTQGSSGSHGQTMPCADTFPANIVLSCLRCTLSTHSSSGARTQVNIPRLQC